MQQSITWKSLENYYAIESTCGEEGCCTNNFYLELDGILTKQIRNLDVAFYTRCRYETQVDIHNVQMNVYEMRMVVYKVHVHVYKCTRMSTRCIQRYTDSYRGIQVAYEMHFNVYRGHVHIYTRCVWTYGECTWASDRLVVCEYSCRPGIFLKINGLMKRCKPYLLNTKRGAGGL